LNNIVSLDRKKIEYLIKKNKVLLLEKIHYMLKMKKLSLIDFEFCINKFLQNSYFYEAVILFREGVINFPKNTAIVKNFVVLLIKLKLFEEAFLNLNYLLKFNQEAQTLSLLGTVFEQTRDYKNALISYEIAKKEDAKNLGTYFAISRVYKKLGQLNMCFKTLQEALQISPKNIDLLLAYANELFEVNKLSEAKKVYEDILSINPNSVPAYSNLGVANKELGLYEESLEAYERALKLKPDNSGVYSNIGVLYKVQKKFLLAFKNIKKALELNPNNIDANANMGVILKETNKPKWALTFYEKALKLNPAHVNANLDYGITKMLLGDYKIGLKHYQHRMSLKEMLPKLVGLDPKLSYKKGTDINKKRVLVFGEQGFGDAIQFSRFIKLLQDKGAFVILRVRKELKKLFVENKIADIVIVEGEEETYDYHMPLLSIPYFFDINPKEIEFKNSYLKVISKEKKEKNKFKKIAFVFGGSTTHKGHQYRFIDPENFRFLTKLKNTMIYNFQMGEDKEKLKKCNFYKDIIDKTDEIENFYDSAVLLSTMDLLITSDTSVVHLAGSLGVNTLLLLPSNPDWRWGREGRDTFWYPSVKLFRQKEKESWVNSFSEIKFELKELGFMN
jgi:tetratricopeptide (TPR) repeat protein